MDYGHEVRSMASACVCVQLLADARERALSTFYLFSPFTLKPFK